MKILSILGVILLVASVCSAATLRVPSQYTYVYDAVDAAASGDTVLVASGTHYNPPGQELFFNILQKDNISIISESGAESTILECHNGGSRSQIRLASGCTVEGLNFVNFPHQAIDIDDGYGHIVRNCSFTFTGSILFDEFSGCSVIECSFEEESGGVTMYGTCNVEGCTFNSTWSQVNVIGNETVTISNNLFFGSTFSSPIILKSSGTVEIHSNVITGNTGYGIEVECTGTAFLSNNTLANNGMGGIRIKLGSPSINHNIIAENTGAGVVVDVGANPMFFCNDVWGNSNYANGNYVGYITDQTGYNGNISEDPLFCNSDLDDYSVDADSPVLSQDCGVMGALPDPGCSTQTATAQKSWGAIKSMYR